MSAIEELPAELITQIVSPLSRSDVLSIRQVSRYLQRATFDHFAHLFFRKRGFLITTESLEVLQALSQHQGLRKHVQHVWFNPDCFTFVDNPYTQGGPDTVCMGQHYHEHKGTMLERYVRDHQELLYTSRLRIMLEGIFKSLPTLRTVGMRRGNAHSPSGWRALRRTTGLDPRQLGDDARLYARTYSDPTYLFVATVKALAASGRQLRRLYTDAIQIDHFPQSLLPSRSEYTTALKSVQYVEINATGPLDESDVDTSASLDSAKGSERGLQMMLKSMPELLEICLTIFKDPKQRHMIAPDPLRPESWMGTYPFIAFRSISQDVRLHNLRRVKLEKLVTNKEVLRGFLQPCGHVLMSLKLRHVQLLVDSVLSRPWQDFFAFLRNDCQSIEYLLLHDLSCNGASVRFDAHDAASHRSVVQQFITGSNVHHFDNLNLEMVGHANIDLKLLDLMRHLHYGPRQFSYEMDDNVWYTDTSDEDW